VLRSDKGINHSRKVLRCGKGWSKAMGWSGAGVCKAVMTLKCKSLTQEFSRQDVSMT
jgi:hypothetical protein